MQNGLRGRPLYEDQEARLSTLANGWPKGRIRLCRLFRLIDRDHLQTGRAIRFVFAKSATVELGHAEPLAHPERQPLPAEQCQELTSARCRFTDR